MDSDSPGSATRLKFTTDVFVFPYEGQYALYAPLRRKAMLVNTGAVALLARIQNGDELSAAELSSPFIELLHDAALLSRHGEEGSTDLVRFPQSEQVSFAPTELTLFLTTDCYQRCRYCYASGGSKSETMSFEVAAAAIGLVVQNTLALGEDRFSVGFHGGGEPACRWELLTQCTRYAQKLARQHHLRLQLSTATGGALLASQARWLAENMSGGSSISLDGPPEFQNSQRPLRGGYDSFDLVDQTLKIWDSMSFSYGIRATITCESVARMADIISFIGSEYKTEKVQFEPLFECGRCRTSKMAAPDPEEFAARFAEAKARAEGLGINLVYSGARTNELTDSYCGGGRAKYLWVTHGGYVTACFEVLEPTDPRSELFFIGHYDHEGKCFRFQLERLAYLQQRRVQNLACCADCLAKWHCAGDCMAKAALAGDVFDPSRMGRCLINQKLTMYQIASLLDKEGAYYGGKEGELPT